MALEIVPITLNEAKRFVKDNHRHNPETVGHKFSIGASDGEKIVGVVMVGRPVARHLDNGWVLEVNRCCTDGTKNANSLLYAAAWRAARALGYRRLITYTLKTEAGTGLLAAGWKVIGETSGGSWNCKARPRVDKHTLGQRTLWEASPMGTRACR